ncbi:hypothetical protein GIB67_010252 [Kingdonia uniflora]|uniref:Uncharacterized protein n=1 Tax=Kingdonia uniflora TaxID=39325 RepID=A0A7J7NBE0_9MAGN|nr:hypothetical protein GIB67_010252 [Kingdonia uniflora]
MGNYVSCTLSNNTGKHSKGAKVVLPNGDIRQFDDPIKAAEIMLDIPNHFLVNTKSMKIGWRFMALNADEDLEMGNVYVMFVMKRVNSVITAADMGALFVTANAVSKKGSGSAARVTPEATVNLDDVEDVLSVLEFEHRVSMGRSRKPALETIIEESISSR